MNYKRFDDAVIARIDRGEEITEQVRIIAESEGIKLASVEALGAINDFTAGVFNTSEKKYYANHFQGTFEIVSLTGTISTKDGEFYQHLHIDLISTVLHPHPPLLYGSIVFLPIICTDIITIPWTRIRGTVRSVCV